jgi:hypothetical protein
MGEVRTTERGSGNRTEALMEWIADNGLKESARPQPDDSPFCRAAPRYAIPLCRHRSGHPTTTNRPSWVRNGGRHAGNRACMNGNRMT